MSNRELVLNFLRKLPEDVSMQVIIEKVSSLIILQKRLFESAGAKGLAIGEINRLVAIEASELL